MRIFLALAFLLLPIVAAAQQQPPPQAPETTALGQMLMEGMQREASLRTQLVGVQAEVTALRKQVEDAAKPKPTEHKPEVRQ